MKMKRRLFSPIWYLKQLLPLTYRSKYMDNAGYHHYAVWRMWFGRVFDHDDVIARDPIVTF